MHAPILTVPGLRNLGKTCFAGSLLQALASCTSLLRQLQRASEHQGLGPFSAPLLDILQRLQPSYAAPSSETPAEVLHALRQCLAPHLLPVGEEADVIEAYEAMMGVLSCELQKAFARRKPQLESQGGLAAVLRPPPTPPANAFNQPDQQEQQQGDAADACWSEQQGGSLEDSALQPTGVPARPQGAACEATTSPLPAAAAESSRADQDQATGMGLATNAGAAYCNGLHPAEAQANGGLRAGSQGYQGQASSNSSSSSGEEQEKLPAELKPGRQEGEQYLSSSLVEHGLADSSSSSRSEGQVEQPVGWGPWAHVDNVLRCWHDTSRLLCEGSLALVLQCLRCHHRFASQGLPLPDTETLHLDGPPPQGSLASELQCLRCHHRFASQVVPFLALPLSIPLAPGRTLLGHVPAAPGASLEQCLCSFFGYEVLPGVTCTRCSIQASLAAAQQAGNLPPALASLQQALQRRAALLESDIYEEAVRSAGLEWVVCRSHVAKRQLLARLPAVLCLQLRRAFWAAAGEVKVAGHVTFPLNLRLHACSGVPRLGQVAVSSLAAEQPQQAAEAAGGGMEAEGYHLRAVLVHYGGSASGHYVVYRCLDSGQRQWVRISDEVVEVGVHCDEVLSTEATALIYERQ